MTCQGSIYRNTGCLPIADFTHKYDVWVLAQDTAKACGKSEIGFDIDMDLIDAFDAVFDRVFNCRDIFFTGIEDF